MEARPRAGVRLRGRLSKAFGIDDLDEPLGPFMRPRARELDVELEVTRGSGFPADGLDRIRTAVTAVVDGYRIGQEVWLNDVLRAAEGVAGTRVTSITVQFAAADVSGVAVPLDIQWALPTAGIIITIT